MAKQNLLREKNFRALALCRFCFSFASQSQAVIVGWQIYALTHSPLFLGLIGLAEAIPAILCSLYSGHIVDQGSPYKIYRLTFLTTFLNSLMLFVLACQPAGFNHQLQITLIFVAVFVSGLARSFSAPSAFSLLRQMVPRSRLPEASAWISSSFYTAAIVGPALAGLVFGFIGAPAAFGIPLVFFCAGFFQTFRFQESVRLFRNEKSLEPALENIKQGIRFVYRDSVILSALSLDMFSVLFGGATAMLPVYADQVLHVGSHGLGFLRAAPAVGSVLTGFCLGLRPFKVISGKVLLVGVCGFGFCIICFGLSHNFILSLLFLFLSGVFDNFSVVIRSTILQLKTPDSMRGRVSAINTVFVSSSNEIGAFESGLAASLMGVVPSVVFGGVMTFVVAGVTAFVSSTLWKLKLIPDAEEKKA